MNASELAPAEREALSVLATAHTTSRPCRASNRTTRGGEIARREMLTVQHHVADRLVGCDLARVTNEVLRTLELTDTGRRLAREAGIGPAPARAFDPDNVRPVP